MLDFSESGECRQKLLMDLPDTARLISNGYEIAPQSTYLIDRESNVYIYLDELKAAVESEYAYACDENGDQIAFSVQEARRFPVLSMEEYLDLVIDCVELLPPDMTIHRITGDGPKKLLVSPLWSGNKRLVLNSLHRRFKERDTWQGKHFPL